MPSSERTITVGMLAWHAGRKGIIKALIDLDAVLFMDAETGETMAAGIQSIQMTPPVENQDAVKTRDPPDLLDISEKSLEVAKRRYETIAPLLGGRSRSDVVKRAGEVGVSVATLYNWLRAYEESNVLSSLLRRGRADKGKARISPEIEGVIEAHLQKRYLSSQRISKRKFAEEVQDACRASGLEIPHFDTIRARIEKIPEYERQKRRGGKAKAQQLEPVEGEFPGADWPLAYVFMDHTPMDVEVVDDITRAPIGRPWLTLALDGYSRMVMGYYISLDPPSSLSVSMCLAQAMLPKDELVARAGCENKWPIWGKIGTLHLDNAKEFRGKALALACEEYGIDLQWRPVARPNFGGRIERMMGTLGTELHTLPGTTFSNSQERGEYDSGKHAAFTLAELERWVTQFIVDVYQQRKHSTLGTPPIKKFQEGILGTGGQKGRGLIPVPNDAARIRLDFMPYIERSIQRAGVTIDGVHYYDPVLRPWIKAKDPDVPQRARQFMFRRDPRDISRIYFYDPDLKQYFAIPYRDRTRPAISIWELRAAVKLVRAEQKGAVDEDAIFRANQRLRKMEQSAVEETRRTRRAAQRRRLHGQAQRDVQSGVAQQAKIQGEPVVEVNPLEDLPAVLPYDDVAFGDDA
jgi:putative transposase